MIGNRQRDRPAINSAGGGLSLSQECCYRHLAAFAVILPLSWGSLRLLISYILSFLFAGVIEVREPLYYFPDPTVYL
ncbi:hypothetical protein EPR50_G00015120 [Perca flavescens]|uniref:Uncharacterized protein n=1 Tax=Perca flavescens TaxID=8167 RepID=A0A484DNE1_PERFV|nr:hypothetical protein EPR50_G00015120 [Perca flavescens]